MELAWQNPPLGWRDTWPAQAQAHPYRSAGLLLARVAVALPLASSLWRVATGEADAALRLAMLGGLAAFAATAAGALPALVLRELSSRSEDTLLGLAAGMMLAASSFSLILPGLAAGEQLTGSTAWGAATVVTGLALGVLLMLGLDQFTPHEHAHAGPCGAGCGRIDRVWLLVFAIALHNLPEGMAIGVAFAQGDLAFGLPLTTAIALQDIPEGLAVAMALKAAGLAPLRAVG